jgi:hypothetical protein
VIHVRQKWAIRHESDNKLDGRRVWLACSHGGLPILFGTRAEARAYIGKVFGHHKRPDLQREPFGWKMPRAVRVAVSVTEV